MARRGMKSLGLILAVFTAGLAAPAQALTYKQETCVESEIPEPVHQALFDEYRSNVNDGPAFFAFAGKAVECAIKYDLPADKHEAYVFYARARSIGGRAQDALAAGGYPLDALDDAVEFLIKEMGGLEKVFDLENGFKPEAYAILFQAFKENGIELVPSDPAMLAHYTDMIFSLAEMAALADVLDLHQN